MLVVVEAAAPEVGSTPSSPRNLLGLRAWGVTTNHRCIHHRIVATRHLDECSYAACERLREPLKLAVQDRVRCSDQLPDEVDVPA